MQTTSVHVLFLNSQFMIERGVVAHFNRGNSYELVISHVSYLNDDLQNWTYLSLPQLHLESFTHITQLQAIMILDDILFNSCC